MRKPLVAAGSLACLAAAGVLAALTLAPAAQAYTIDQLPSLGYSVATTYLTNGCRQYEAGYGTTPRQLIGTDCDTDFQAKVDAFVAATCPCAQPPTTAPPAETTAPATTATADPPPPPPPPVTVTVTVTTTTPPPVEVVDELTARIVALEQKIAALTTRVDRLGLAGDASWLAYQQSVANADPADVAAGLARATWLNAVYGLGVFA